MNKKLLITIGDSWTEGVGSYPIHILKKYGNPPVFHFRPNPDMTDVNYQKEYWKNNSWCNLLAKKIKYDLVNLGRGGSANPTISKLFYEHVYQNTFNQYEKILVIFLLSSPIRISFYKNGDHIDMNLYDISHLHENFYPFCKFFLTDIQNDYRDMCLESTYNVRSVEALCQAKKFDFFYGTAFSDINDIYHDRKNCINPENISCFANLLQKDEIAKCNHPNEKGYFKIANVMYDELNKKGYEF